MSVREIRAFLERYEIAASIERAGENWRVPADWANVEQRHYMLSLSRPGYREFVAPLTFAMINANMPDPSVETAIWSMAAEIRFYEAHPTPERWLAAKGLPPGHQAEDFLEKFESFEHERTELIAIMGDQYEEFLRL